MTRFEDALKLGYVVEERSGRRRAFMMFECRPVLVGSSHDYDNMWEIYDRETGAYIGAHLEDVCKKSIRRILRPRGPGAIMNVVRGDGSDDPTFTTVWRAAPEPKELTVADVAELLGYPVKIVEG